MAQMSMARRRVRRKREDQLHKTSALKKMTEKDAVGQRLDSAALARQIQNSSSDTATGATLQARLVVSPVNDAQEAEADQVADAVIASTSAKPQSQQSSLQRQADDEKKEPEPVQARLQRQAQPEEEEEVQAKSEQSPSARSAVSSRPVNRF